MGLLSIAKKYRLLMRQECRKRFPRHRLQRKPLVSDPGIHHGTCFAGSRIRGGGENVPGIPGACATRNFAYLVRGPYTWLEIKDRKGNLAEKMPYHYGDVIMSAMASQITSFMIVYSTNMVYPSWSTFHTIKQWRGFVPLLTFCSHLLTCAPRRSIVLQFVWHVDTRPISPFLFFFNSTFYLWIIMSFFTWCIWYINWSCWQSYITLSVLMFCDTDKSSSFHCTVPGCLELIWVGVCQEVYLNFHHFCG